ncbi:MAG: HEAT repeat domain-containing protein, partial [Polyangiales bacterium]
TSVSERLVRATHTPDAWVAAEAAIALGRMYDERALRALRRLVASEDPGVRSRAAVSLGRLRDKAAVPALIDALWIAPTLYEREEAVRWLGRIGDVSALDPLLNLLPEAHTRHLVVIALGELGDTRAFGPLVSLLESDRNTNVRDGVVRGLAILGDPRALPVLVPLATDDPALRNTGEALVRLHALEQKLIAGVDLEPGAHGVFGFSHCKRGPWRHDWDFLHRTHCTSARERASLRVNVPEQVARAAGGATLIAELRRVDASGSTPLELKLNDRSEQLQIDGAWHEVRISLPAGALDAGQAQIEVRASDPHVRFDLDHVLIVPRATLEVAEAILQ